MTQNTKLLFSPCCLITMSCSITFGGGGIYGACKDICISHIHGALVLTAQPAGVDKDGIHRPARLIVQFEAPNAESSGKKGKKKATAKSRKESVESKNDNGIAGNSARRSAADTDANQNKVHAHDGSERRETAISPGKMPAKMQTFPNSSQTHIQNRDKDRTTTDLPSNNDGRAASPLPKRSVSFPSPLSMGRSRTNRSSEEKNGITSSDVLQHLQIPQGSVPDEGGQPARHGKSRRFAARFLKRLGNRKERFQGKELPHLQPAPDREDMNSSDGKPRRSLAKKLLGRKSTRGSSASSVGDVSDDLSRLTFGGHDPKVHSFRHSIDAASSTQCSESESADRAISEEDFGLDAVPEVEGIADERKQETTQLADMEEEGSGVEIRRENEDAKSDDVSSPLTHEALQRAEARASEQRNGLESTEREDATEDFFARSMSGRGSWLKPGGVNWSVTDGTSTLEDDVSSVIELADAEDELSGSHQSGHNQPRGVFCSGRLSGFELIGERGSKCPNLTIGRADVRATVFVRFVFEYTQSEGWRPGTQPGDKPMFHVENLSYKISGNNVPMPPTLIKHILRVAIPGLIQRRILGIMPKELGDYLTTIHRGFSLTADVGVVGPAIDVLDADLGFEIRGPTKSAREARHQASQYAASKEARRLLGLSLPQAQTLAELFSGSASLFELPRKASISSLISFVANYEKHPKIFVQLCRVIDSAYHVLAEAQSHADVSDFSFSEFLAGPVACMRRKPAKTRVLVRKMDIGVDIDAIVTAVHDFTQRTIEESIIKGPLTDPSATLESMKLTIAEDLELLHAWHAFALRELHHFKSKFRGAAGTLLAAADINGFSAGVENCHYEGPLRVRIPISVRVDPDGAVSFDLPLPTPQGSLGIFMDNFKSLLVPAHLRPPAAAVNWIRLTGDAEMDSRMEERLRSAIQQIEDTLKELGDKIQENELYRDDKDPSKVLSQPRTSLGERLGRLIVNRLKLRVRLDERRIGEILSGIDGASMGGDTAFTVTAGRIIGHLGDVMALGFVPAGSHPTVPGETASGLASSPDRYLMHMESSDISRLRAEIQSLGFQSAINPGGAVRLVHAFVRAASLGFLGRSAAEMEFFRDRMKGWYNLMTKEALNVSACIDVSGEVKDTSFIMTLCGEAVESQLRATSPLVVTNEIDLVPLGKAMRGDPPES